MFLNIKFYFEIFVDLVVVVRNNRDPMYPLAIPPLSGNILQKYNTLWP